LKKGKKYAKMKYKSC